MIQSGGTTVIGTSITACLTTLTDAVNDLKFSRDKHAFVEMARITLFIHDYRLPPDHETAIRKATYMLDKFWTPRHLRTISASIMMYAAQHLTFFTSYILTLLEFGFMGFGQALVELCFYNTAFLCRSLPRDSKILLLGYFEQQLCNLFGDLIEMMREQPIKPRRLKWLIDVRMHIEAISTIGRLTKVMFDASDAMSTRIALIEARTGLMLREVAKLVLR